MDELKSNVYYLDITCPDYDGTLCMPIGVYSSLELAKAAASLVEIYDVETDEVFTDTIVHWEPNVAEKTWVSEVDSAIDCYFEIHELELDAIW